MKTNEIVIEGEHFFQQKNPPFLKKKILFFDLFFLFPIYHQLLTSVLLTSFFTSYLFFILFDIILFC